jgi:hypothetical protein
LCERGLEGPQLIRMSFGSELQQHLLV